MRDRGFTLVEVLAALLVFSVAITGLTHSGTESIRAVSILQNKTYAGIVADNQIIRSRLMPLKAGQDAGEEEVSGRIYLWQVETRETDNKGFYRIVATIRQKDDDQIMITRTAFRTAS